MTHSVPSLPIPIFQASEKVKRYMLYDIDAVTWLRRNHNILGVLIGTLPQIPSQNVFLSLPLELQPEEALLLVNKGLAYVVDDQSWHREKVVVDSVTRKDQIKDSLRREGLEIAKDIGRKRQMRTEKALKGKKIKEIPEPSNKADGGEDALFDDSPSQENQGSHSSSSASNIQAWAITPATSASFSSPISIDTGSNMPQADPSSYALFSHLHQRGYFMTPGLRFGCQFSVYPGDPLRYHSHFLAMSADWDEDIDLLHLVGGGRLATGVKKGWMIGGIQKEGGTLESQDSHTTLDNPHVRTFCIEWGGM